LATLATWQVYLLVGCVELITVTTPQKYVNVTRGGSVKLQCMFVTIQETNGLTIQWDFVPSSSLTQEQVDTQSFYVHFKCTYTGQHHCSFTKMRRIPPSSPGSTRNASIIISNMQPSDAGVYSCEVHNFPDVDGQSQVNIIVNVLGKEASYPYCAVHGDIESGPLVTLTCHSEHGSPKPMYTWTRLDQTKTRRPVLGRSESTKTGILEIRNISQFEFGEYQCNCNATNVVGFSICSVDLSPEVGDGVIAGAVIGALLGCVLIILVVWFIAHTMKRHKYRLHHVISLPRPREQQTAFLWQPQPAMSMLRQMMEISEALFPQILPQGEDELFNETELLLAHTYNPHIILHI
uniref:V-set and immunoglobulin domain-containing protein 1 n=1 Tax=Seriola dumerili TaxID=41447 RepID=A0A3B4UTI3_SERDU